MIWTPKKKPPAPLRGDKREVVKFAWKPVWLDDGRKLWLQRYLATEKWDRYFNGSYGIYLWGWCLSSRRELP